MNNNVHTYKIRRYIEPKHIINNNSKHKKGVFVAPPDNYISITKTIRNIFSFIIKTKNSIKKRKNPPKSDKI